MTTVFGTNKLWINYKPGYKLTGGKSSVTCSFMKTEDSKVLIWNVCITE